MRLQLRTLPAVLLSIAALTLSACGGSGEPEPSSADTEPTPTDSASEQSTADADESAESTEPTEQATSAETEWVAITDEPSGITFSMPGLVEPEPNDATVGDGTSVALRNYTMMADEDIEVGFNVIDTPGADYDFDAGIQGVANSLGGEVVSTTEAEVDGNAAVDVEMTYGEDYIVFFQLVTGEQYIVQSLASGRQDEREAVQQTYRQLIDSVTGF